MSIGAVSGWAETRLAVSSALSANNTISSRFCRGSQAIAICTISSRVPELAAFYGERRMVRYSN